MAGIIATTRSRVKNWRSLGHAPPRSAHDGLHNGGSVTLVEACNDAPVKLLRFLWPAGFPEEVGGGFPGLQHFPSLPGMLLGNAGVQFHGLIETALLDADITEATE